MRASTSLVTLSYLLVSIQAAYTSTTFISHKPTSKSSSTRLLDSMSSSSSSREYLSNVRIMVNGMPGPMATAAAEACLRKGLQLAPIAITGPDVSPCTINVMDPVTQRSAKVRLLPSTQRAEIESAVEGLKVALHPVVPRNIATVPPSPNDASAAPPNIHLLAIDFTHPSAVNDNALFYIANDIPFVMGTTGGDRVKLLQDMHTVGHSLSAVIAPNMGKQIVALQTAIHDLAIKFPGAFQGYTLQVVESHQKTKADTSGTAKAIVDDLKVLSATPSYSYEDIVQLRTDEQSLNFGVSPEALNGHAFHTYTLTSPDKSVVFELKHNVEGRTVYADGTADAVKFLALQLFHQQGNNNDATRSGKIYSMMDVLLAGAME
jgi:4-hydroxy-tetrahydrodipicolinate reductase